MPQYTVKIAGGHGREPREIRFEADNPAMALQQAGMCIEHASAELLQDDRSLGMICQPGEIADGLWFLTPGSAPA
ncbi:MAG: hypothetical protein DI636_05630 [Pelagerythrobacter marensis]|nr:MAG: hypothetical protein DI636_05630 [Pelagerythrobacter marensis]PZU17077.1 MAG: hypothetical protein DI591_04135 [Citromicrobium sp.]